VHRSVHTTPRALIASRYAALDIRPRDRNLLRHASSEQHIVTCRPLAFPWLFFSRAFHALNRLSADRQSVLMRDRREEPNRANQQPALSLPLFRATSIASSRRNRIAEKWARRSIKPRLSFAAAILDGTRSFLPSYSRENSARCCVFDDCETVIGPFLLFPFGATFAATSAMARGARKELDGSPMKYVLLCHFAKSLPLEAPYRFVGNRDKRPGAERGRERTDRSTDCVFEHGAQQVDTGI
jgi:hypothetical protein